MYSYLGPGQSIAASAQGPLNQRGEAERVLLGLAEGESRSPLLGSNRLRQSKPGVKSLSIKA